jgi:glyoxylase-like metal-dependent hydrolase (beta-lactamase superfamily II)
MSWGSRLRATQVTERKAQTIPEVQGGRILFEDLQIELLCDGIVHVDAGGPFGLVPRVLYEPHFPVDDANRVPQSLTCMLVRSQGKTIVIDTGLGPKLGENEVRRWNLQRPDGDLVDVLRRKGVEPEQVDLVIDTHLHWDHCGGNTERVDGDVVPRFPNATYIVQRTEWSKASRPDARTQGTYLGNNFVPLMERGALRLIQGDTRVTDHVRCVVTPGHTRAHQSIVLENGDWRGLFVADMASYAIHMARTAWLTSYDVLPLENIRTKEKWQEWALANGAWLFFQHDPFLAIGRLERQERGRLAVVPVDEAAELTSVIPTPQPLAE